MNTPDYKGVDADEALKDFKQRRENYMSVYEPVDERDGSYIKIVNNLTFIVHNARGYLPQKVRLRVSASSCSHLTCIHHMTGRTFLSMF